MADDGGCRLLAADDWRTIDLPLRRAARFRFEPECTLAVRADAAVAFLARPLTAEERAATFVSWRWRVDEAPPPTDPRRKGGDDRPIAVHLWFAPEDRPADDVAAVAPSTLMRRGYLLSWMWGGSAPCGSTFRSPYADRGRIAVLRDATTPHAEWRRERIAPAADFARAFGLPPRPPDWIAISADTDDARGNARARIGDLRFAAENAPTSPVCGE